LKSNTPTYSLRAVSQLGCLRKLAAGPKIFTKLQPLQHTKIPGFVISSLNNSDASQRLFHQEFVISINSLSELTNT